MSFYLKIKIVRKMRMKNSFAMSGGTVAEYSTHDAKVLGSWVVRVN
jgi:hypothetical protein